MLKFVNSNNILSNVSSKECFNKNVVSKVFLKNNDDIFFNESSFLDLELSNNDNFNNQKIITSKEN